MKHLEPVPASLLNAVRARLATGEDELIRIASDLTAESQFGQLWLIVTDRRILIAPSADVSSMKESLVGDVAGARTEALVGGGCLHIELKRGPPLSVMYSAALSHTFAEVARGIEQLRRGEFLQL